MRLEKLEVILPAQWSTNLQLKYAHIGVQCVHSFLRDKILSSLSIII